MKKLLLIFFLLPFLSLNAQKDSLSDHSEKKELRYDDNGLFDVIWAPVGLSLLSVDLMRDSAKYGLQTLLRSPVPDTFRSHLDDYLQYAPIVMMYTADLFRVPSRNTVWNQTKFLAMSEMGTAVLVQAMKYGFGIRRPNNGAANAYPSGHTSQAFVASQVLFNEYRDSAPLLAYSGFLFSVPTGALRILNNRHWLPDVLLGAGVAMLVTNLVYYYEPLKDWNPWKKKNRKADVGFFPSLGDDYMGGYLSIKF